MSIDKYPQPRKSLLVFSPLLARGRRRPPRDRREHAVPLPHRLVIAINLLLYQQVLRGRLLSIILQLKLTNASIA